MYMCMCDCEKFIFYLHACLYLYLLINNLVSLNIIESRYFAIKPELICIENLTNLIVLFLSTWYCTWVTYFLNMFVYIQIYSQYVSW